VDDLRGVLRLSIGVLCAAALVLILIILSGSRVDDTSAKAIGTAMALAFLSLTGVAGSHLSMRRPHLALVGHATAVVSGLAFVVTVAALWSGLDDGGWRPAAYSLIVAFACGHSCVLLAGSAAEESDGVQLVRAGTIAALWFLVALAITEISSRGPDHAQGIGVVAVVYGLGTIVLPLLRRSAQSPPPRDELQVDHKCLVWPDTAESAVAHLRARGIAIAGGPVAGSGAHGPGVSVYYREPGGNLVELISYR